MSKGSKITVIRLGESLDREIGVEIARLKQHHATPGDMSTTEFIRMACREFLRKKKAGRVPKKKAQKIGTHPENIGCGENEGVHRMARAIVDACKGGGQ